MGGGKKRPREDLAAFKVLSTPTGEADANLQHYQSHIQVLATDVDHNSPSLLLFVDREGRLLFNAGEGLQRMFRENKLRMVKLDRYLFTRVSTETMAGLPGMLLSSGAGTGANNDAGGLLDTPQNTIQLYGPQGLEAYLNAFKGYVNNEQALDPHEIGVNSSNTALLKSQYLTITPLLLQGTAGKGPSCQASVCYVVELAGTPGKFDPKAADRLGLPQGPVRAALVKGSTVELSDGRVVTPDDVRSASQPGPVVVVVDVPTLDHLATLQQQPQLLAPWLGTGANTGTGSAAGSAQDRLVVVAHLSPTSLTTTPAYTQWMGSLGPHVKHVMAGMGTTACTLKRATTLQAKLNCISPRLYPMLQPPSPPPSWPSIAATPAPAPAATAENGATAANSKGNKGKQKGPADAGSKAASTSGVSGPPAPSSSPAPASAAAPPAHYLVAEGLSEQQAVLGTCLLKYRLIPVLQQGLDTSEVAAEVDVGAVRSEYQTTAREVVELAQAAVGPQGGHQLQGAMDVEEPATNGTGGHHTRAPEDSIPECLQGIHREEFEITFLGTASSQPSKYRNVTALYVDCFSRGGLLLDCGEDTLGQLKRRYGAQDTERRVRELQMVWVSHMHADHHGGLYRLLELRTQLLRQSQQTADATAARLLIVGPGFLFPVLRKYEAVVPDIRFDFIPNEHFTVGLPPPGVPRHVLAAFDKAMATLGISLKPVPVHHVSHACGVRLSGRSGWSVVFSGDTRPCDSLVEAAKGASLLIHEATFEDDKAEDARKKKHSTTGEALQVAQRAGVYRVILTHFSTRYPTMPVVDIAANPHMTVACDFMSVNLADLPWLPRITTPLAELFKREEKGWEADEAAPMAAQT